MEYMHPLWVGKPPLANTGKVCWLVIGEETDVITTHPRTSKDILALRTRNFLKLAWFLAAYKFTVVEVEYEPVEIECPMPKYG